MDLAVMLAEMDTALADEIATVQRHDRSGRIARQGQLVSELGGHYIYTFSLDEPWEPEDDTPLSIKIPGASRVQGTIVSASGTSLTIVTEVELPPEALAQIRLVDDPVQLLERLREAVKASSESESHLGSKAFALLPFASGRRQIQEAYPDFAPRASQAHAIQLALGSEVAYIIGPPGTGKTSTLAAIAYMLVCEGRSVLIAAHTNVAVDNAIAKLADMCHKANVPALREGRILRFGTPQLQSVSQRDDIYPPKIVKRLGLDLERQRADLRASHTDALARLQALTQNEEQFAAQWAARRNPLAGQRQRCAEALLALQRGEQQRVADVDRALQQTAHALARGERQLDEALRELSQLVAFQAQTEHGHQQHLAAAADLSARLVAAQRLRNCFESHPAGLERAPPRVMRRSMRWLMPA